MQVINIVNSAYIKLKSAGKNGICYENTFSRERWKGATQGIKGLKKSEQFSNAAKNVVTFEW